jgi:hypothetical protein
MRWYFSCCLLSFLVLAGQISSVLAEENPHGMVQYLVGNDYVIQQVGDQMPVEMDPAISTTGRSGPVWEAGGELTLLNPMVGSVVLNAFGAFNGGQVTPEYGLNAAWRVWVGQEFANGLGWQVSYWQFGDSSSVTLRDDEGDTTTITRPYNFFTVNVEATKRVQLNGWDVIPSMGLQVAGVKTRFAINHQSDDPFTFSLTQDFTGVGLTFALAGDHPLPWNGFKVYGSVRGSLIYGNQEIDINAKDFDSGVVGGGISTTNGHINIVDQTVCIWQMRAGVQYQRPVPFGVVYGRVGVEGQLWELPPIFGGLGDSNIGLIGPTFAAGLLY